MKGKVKKGYVFLFCSLALLLVSGTVFYKDHILTEYKENLFLKSVIRATQCLTVYENTGKEEELTELAGEISVLFQIWKELKNDNEPDSFDTEIYEVRDLLIQKGTEISYLDMLHRGLEFLQSDIYSEAGGEWNRFLNANRQKEDE